MKKKANIIQEQDIKIIKEPIIIKERIGIIQSPEGFMIGLVSSDKSKEDFKLSLSKSDEFRLGSITELAFRVDNLDNSLDFWKKLGFKPQGIYEDPYPWAIIGDGLIILGLHQSKEISNRPTLTYFSKNQAENIEELKKEGFNIINQMDESNAVLEAPDGHLLNLFQWE